MLLTGDAKLLFVTRSLRLFSYGMLSVVLVLYLADIGLTDAQAGLLLTCTLAGDTAVSLALTTQADRFGRKRTLVIGAALMFAAGVVFALTRNYLLLIVAGAVGVISPSGNEVGPFLSIEQAALSEVVTPRHRTSVFAWYTLTGAFATAVGSLSGGLLCGSLQHADVSVTAAQRMVIAAYAAMGILLALCFGRLSAAAEAHHEESTGGAVRLLGLGASRDVVLRLSALSALDAFGGGFVVQSLAAYWFHLRFGVEAAALGGIFFGANVFAGISALLASRLAARIGLIRTMVFTHLPSNVLLMLVPLMPTAGLATLVLLARFSISQMDVPTRQSYTMAVVAPAERSAAAGITGVARTTGASIAPFFAGLFFSKPAWINAPFYLAGALKIIYDLLLYRSFAAHDPPKE